MTWTLERIRLKCVECGDCLLWQGGMMAKLYPIAQEPAPELTRKQRQFYVRRKVWELTKGRPAPSTPRKVLTVKCGEARCVAPKHLVVMTKSKRLKQAAEAGAFRTLSYRAKVSKARSRGSKVPDQDVPLIRGCSESLAALAARYGISVSYAGALRSGTARRDYSSPFAALQP